MYTLIKIISFLIILLGIFHISFALPLQMDTDSLWFVGTGMGIIFSGLLNLVAIDRGGSKFSKSVAMLVNTFNSGMFFYALFILDEPQVYVGIGIFLIAAIALLIDLFKRKQTI